MNVRALTGTALALSLMLTHAEPSRSETAADVLDLYRKSYVAEAQGKNQEALDAMRAIQARGGNSYFVHLRSAWLAYLAGRHGEAKASYQRAILAETKAIEPRLGLTLPLLAIKDWMGLERASREVLALDPKNGVARARLAYALYSMGNFPDSASTYRTLVVDYPGDLDYRTGLGWCLAKMGRVNEAKQIFAAVLAVSPDNQNASQGMKL